MLNYVFRSKEQATDVVYVEGIYIIRRMGAFYFKETACNADVYGSCGDFGERQGLSFAEKHLREKILSSLLFTIDNVNN